MVDLTKWNVTAIGIVACSGAAMAQDHLIGVNRDAEIVRYDTTTGECSVLSQTFGLGDMWSMAKDASGRIFAGSPNRIYQVYPQGIVQYENMNLQKMFSMAFKPGSDTIIYATNWVSSRYEFYRIDITVPGFSQKTLIGGLSQNLNGLVFSPGGTLYGWSNNIGLVIVDPLTGGLIDVNPSVSAPDKLQSISFDSTGTMWGAGDALFTIDPTTGITTSAGGAMCLDVTGIEFSDGLCYADCDTSTGAGMFDIFDFLCFQNAFIGQDPLACDCDVSGGLGVCDIFDFLCFQSSFVSGCS